MNQKDPLLMKEQSLERFFSIQEVCDRLDLSKSRFYTLQKQGIFPESLRNPSNNRPVFDQDLMRQCVEVMKTRMGANGKPVVFNRKRKHDGNEAKRSPSKSKHSKMVASLASLGLITNAKRIDEAMKALPNMGVGLESSELIREVFLKIRQHQ